METNLFEAKNIASEDDFNCFILISVGEVHVPELWQR